MRIYQFYLFFIIVCTPFASSNAGTSITDFPDISENAQISLITGEPGKELYTAWGHSAIRVYDPTRGIDFVYNYGTFDFNAPGFYQKFLQGKLNYFLNVYDFKRMVMEYQYYDQSLYEQIINLSFDEKKEIYEFLNNNALPENKFYLYDFFFDNCSSRIRDVFQDILGPKLVFEDQHITSHKTLRQLLDEFLLERKWGDFGIDLILGLPADQVASSWEYMFLPFKLYDAFENAVIYGVENNKPFVRSTMPIHESAKTPSESSFRISPLMLFWALLFIVIIMSLSIDKEKIALKILDTLLFVIIGLSGMLIAFLWFGTDHIATKDNLNLLWAFPTHIILPFIVFKDISSKWITYYFLFWMIFLILFLGSWMALPQQMNYANIPIILILIIRFFFNYKRFKSYVERRKQQTS